MVKSQAVLVVEKSPDLGFYISRILQEGGHNTKLTDSTKSAVNIISSAGISLVAVSTELGKDDNGYCLCYAIRGEHGYGTAVDEVVPTGKPSDKLSFFQRRRVRNAQARIYAEDFFDNDIEKAKKFLKKYEHMPIIIMRNPHDALKYSSTSINPEIGFSGLVDGKPIIDGNQIAYEFNCSEERFKRNLLAEVNRIVKK